MPDFVPSILMILFWIFIVSAISRVLKKAFGGQKQNPQQAGKKPQTQTFQEIFKEIKRQIDESQGKQNIPPYAKQNPPQEKYPDLKTIVREAKKQTPEIKRKESPLVQKKYEHREMVPETEKQKALAYEKSVANERRKEHDSEMRRLEKKIYNTVQEDDSAPFDLDLRNSVIGSIILERKWEM